MINFAPEKRSSVNISAKLWVALWCVFGLSLFISKSGVSIFGSILVLWSLFKIDWKKLAHSNPIILIMASFFPLALLVSLFSLAGTDAAVHVLRSWSWPLYVIPFFLLFQDKKLLKTFAWAMAVGMIIGCVKALEVFGTKWGWSFSSQTRVDSFWDIGRWAYYLACSSVILFGIYGSKNFNAKATRFEKFAVPMLFIVALVFLVLVNARGPWLATVGGIGLLGISGKRYFKFLVGFLLIFIVSLFAVPGILTRVQSSFSAKTENGVVTSSDASNAGRLHMWKVNGDFFKEQLFFGTGFGSAEKPLRAFLGRQSPDYVSTYVDEQFSFHDQHNSYFWMLTQMGLIFSVLFWGVLLWAGGRFVPAFFKGNDALVKIALAVLVSQLFMFIFYSAISSYEAIWFFAMFCLVEVKCSKLWMSN